MVEIFLCYAECDRGVAEAIAGRLDLAAEATVTFQPCGSGEDQTVATRWEMGEFSQGIVLVLSPECVPPLSRDAWEPLIQHSIGGTAPPVASVLVRDCQFPQVLRRRNHFRWASGDALPALHRWAIRLQPPAGEDWEPVDPLPWFQGREREMDVLWKTIVERAGVAVITGREGSGKSCLAQHLAYHAAEFFRGVAWNPGGQPEEGRFLRVLDDASAPGPAVAGESLLVTARELDLPGAARIHLETMPGPPVEPPARAEELGLWRAMALCSPKGFSLEFAAHIARMGTTALDLSGSLVDKRLADPLSGRGRRLRLGPASRKAALESTDVSALRDRHTRAVSEALKGWRTDVVKSMMAGAKVAMMTSALLRQGIDYLDTLQTNLLEWVVEHEYESIKQMQGSMSQQAVAEPAAFERANYMKVLSTYSLRSPVR